MIFRDLIRDLSERLGLAEAIAVDKEDRFSFEVDGTDVMVQGMDESSSLAMLADVGSPPPERLEALYLELLKANHLLKGTKGAVLSVDPETLAVTLCRILPLGELTAEGLEGEIGRFVSVLLDWRKKVGEFRADETPAEPASGDFLRV